MTAPSILVKLLGGKAFLEHMATASDAVVFGYSHDLLVSDDTLQLHLRFGIHRASTSPVPCQCDPPFSGSYIFDMTTAVRENRDAGDR